jgi:hypothetical protein
VIVDHGGKAARGAGEIIVQLDFMVVDLRIDHSVASFWELRRHLLFRI